MTATAKVVNASHLIVLGGGGKVTLTGAGKRQILYMNTCDKRQQCGPPLTATTRNGLISSCRTSPSRTATPPSASPRAATAVGEEAPSSIWVAS
jgi:hypothetical protein